MSRTAVLDTNVLVSGLINSRGVPSKILDLIRKGQLIPIVSDPILSEYREVLGRPELSKWIHREEADIILDYLGKECMYVVPHFVFLDLPDSDDAIFLETAATADSPLITGNLKHFPELLQHGVVIYSPLDFLKTVI